MQNNWPYIAIIALLIVVHLLDERNDSLREELLSQQNNELQHTLDSTQSELQRSKLVRDSIDILIVSLLRDNKATQLELDKVNKKLKDIPGKFDKLTNKELEAKMIEEWKKR